MTVWLHGKLPLAELDEKAISVPSDSGGRRGRLMSSNPSSPKSMTDLSCVRQQVDLGASCKERICIQILAVTLQTNSRC